MPTPEQEIELVALVKAGHRIASAGRQVGIANTTAWEIVDRHRRANDTESETIPKHDVAIAERAGEVQLGMLDYMAERMESDPEYAWKHGITINAIRGTAVDKIIKRSDSGKTTNVGVFIINGPDTTQVNVDTSADTDVLPPA